MTGGRGDFKTLQETKKISFVKTEFESGSPGFKAQHATWDTEASFAILLRKSLISMGDKKSAKQRSMVWLSAGLYAPLITI